MKTPQLVKNFNVILLFVIIIGSRSFAQNTSLQFFEPYCDKSWTGNYINSEDSAYVHLIRWEYFLDSKFVKETKTVPELGFKMETMYYFDWGENQLSFLSLLNKEMNSKGKVWIEGSKIILEGINYFNGGSGEFKKSFEITEDSKVKDEFFRKNGDSWVKGHLIEYK